MDRQKKNLLVFGYGMALILNFIGLRLWWKYGLSLNKIILIGLGVAFLLATVIRCEFLKPVYDRWMRLAHFLGQVITILLLTFLFYTLFTITALILKICGKKLLDLTMDREKESYWLPRKARDVPIKNYLKQY